MMIKGTNKSVIEIVDTKHDEIERVIVILKPNVSQVNKSDISSNIENLYDDYIKNDISNGFIPKAPPPIINQSTSEYQNNSNNYMDYDTLQERLMEKGTKRSYLKAVIPICSVVGLVIIGAFIWSLI